MNTLAIGIVFIFGAIFGSFLNVVIYRVPRKESLLPDSHCPQCDYKIKSIHNIPIFSWLFLQGKCFNCKKPISYRYPLVELLTGIVFAIVFASFYPITLVSWVEVVGLLVFAFITIALCFIDWELYILPNAIVYPAYALVLVFVGAGLMSGSNVDIVRAFIGLIISGLFYFILWFIAPKGIGLGDVKLAPLLGFITAYYGWGPFIISIFSAYLLASIYSVIVMVKNGKGLKSAIAFGPWMLIGVWVGMFWGTPLFDTYTALF